MAGNTFKALTNNRSNPSKKTTTTKKQSAATGAASQSLGGLTGTMSALGTAYQGKSNKSQMLKGLVTGAANGALSAGFSAFSNGVAQAQPSGGTVGYLGGGYGGGGYGGGGGGDTGPTKEQKQAKKTLAGLAANQAQAAKDKFNNVKDAMDRANANAKKTMEATGHTIGRASSAEWYHNALENPQKTAAAMLDRSGNALSGSMRLSFMDDFQRVFDDATVAAITNEIQQKNDNIYEYAQTVNKNIQELNKMAADTESSLAAGAADYIAQLVNMHPDLAKEYVDTTIFDTATAKDKDVKALLKKNPKLSEKQAIKQINDQRKKQKTTANAAKTIKVPSYLKYSGFYDANKQNLITPNYLTQVRPANARDAARKLNTTSRGNVASAANPQYMQALTTPYGQRKH